MNENVTLRQLVFMFLLISIAPIARQIPNRAAAIAGSSGYLSCILSFIVLMILAVGILVLIKAFPGLNLYEMLTKICGTFLAKIIIFFYLLWFLISAVVKINVYSVMLQSSLMPSMKTRFLILLMMLMVWYGFSKGAKTILRFSEFVLVPILFFALLLMIFSIPKVELYNLLPITIFDMRENALASISVLSIGGNLILLLFFANFIKYNMHFSKMKRKVYFAVGSFSIIAFIACVITIGINGAGLSAKLSYPLFMTIKSVSVLNAVERMESWITLICIFSDFTAISIFAILMIRCMEFLFGKKHNSYYKIVLGVFAVIILVYLDATQFELDYFYQHILVYGNLIFQFAIPCVVLFLYGIEKGLNLQNFNSQHSK